MESALLHIERQRQLLRTEYEAEKSTFTRIAGRVGLTRLTARGRAWYPLTIGRDYFNSLNRRVVEVFRSDSTDPDADHEFEYGRPVVFFITDGDSGTPPHHLFAGTVSYVEDSRMVVTIPDGADLSTLAAASGSHAGVMLSFDETSYRVMFEALDRVAKGKGRLGELRDIFHSPRRVAELSAGTMRFPYLNSSQEQGVNKVLRARDVAIVHGPPGTGKTTTLVEAIHETLRRESQVMVCAQSNMAVDWISEKLVDRGINVLRLGNPSRVNDKMLSFTYERRFEAHPDYPTLWSIRNAIRDLHGARRHNTDQWHSKMDRLRSRATELEIRINNDIFSSAHVIASTLVGSASRVLDGMRFPTVFIDEAAQALEAACWIPMRRASRMILAGDHCQLPPTVKSVEAMKGGLGISLMERIVERHPECVTLLTIQYRMNEDIMRFSSHAFYGGSIIAAPEVRHRGILDLDIPMEWIDTSGIMPEADDGNGDNTSAETDFREALAGESFGRINKAEANLTAETLRAYVDRIGKHRILDERIDIGVISPYGAQVRYLRQLIGRSPWARPLRHLISVNTVDGFQGQERDVIIISLVRNNAEGQIGFLRDLRRMNVAMTRARMKLIIIGDSPTMTAAHPFYRRLHRYCRNLREE